MAKVMFMLTGFKNEPVIKNIVENLGVNERDIDTDFGVQVVDPATGDYCILVEERLAEKLNAKYQCVDRPLSLFDIEAFGSAEES